MHEWNGTSIAFQYNLKQYFYYADVKKVNHQSSFDSIKSGIVHFKSYIEYNDIITMRGSNGIGGYKNQID